MTSNILANLEKLVGTPRDGALLRFSIGNEHLKSGQPERAAGHFRDALEMDPAYSAAWKLLGRALADCGLPREAAKAWREGIRAAESRGDLQAAKEMGVLARRIERSFDNTPVVPGTPDGA